MDACMYIIMNPQLRMSSGKLAAQAAHAAVEAFRLSGIWSSDELISAWYNAKHYKKIVLQCDDLQVAMLYLTERGFRCVPIIDEGRTEFGGDLTFTAIGCCLVDKDDPHVSETFGTFRLYKDAKPVEQHPQRPEKPHVPWYARTWSWLSS
jgi:peptidyl-tRNA hydrolase